MPRPPSFDPARKNARVGPVQLPAEGRRGRPPAWPLPGSPSTDEKRAWAELWATPQAVAWEKLGWTRTIGRYCRILVEAEMPNARREVRSSATEFEDRLGLTPKAMRLMLWQIVEDETAARRQERKSSQGAKQRPRAVDASG